MSKFESDNLSVRIELTIVKHSGLLFMANFFLTVQEKDFILFSHFSTLQYLLLHPYFKLITILHLSLKSSIAQDYHIYLSLVSVPSYPLSYCWERFAHVLNYGQTFHFSSRFYQLFHSQDIVAAMILFIFYLIFFHYADHYNQNKHVPTRTLKLLLSRLPMT